MTGILGQTANRLAYQGKPAVAHYSSAWCNVVHHADLSDRYPELRTTSL
jgi:hypothetical protein